MNKKQIKLDTFQKLFMELLNDVDNILPNDPSILWVKTAVSIMSPETLVSQFMGYIEEYADKIMAKDETFFIEEIEIDPDSIASTEMDKLRTIWRDPKTTQQTKDCLWKYLILLIKLGR